MNMLTQITYFQILGKPLLMYFGIITFLLLLLTAWIGQQNKKGITKIPLVWHFRLAKVTITLAIIHGLLGILAYF